MIIKPYLARDSHGSLLHVPAPPGRLSWRWSAVRPPVRDVRPHAPVARRSAVVRLGLGLPSVLASAMIWSLLWASLQWFGCRPFRRQLWGAAGLAGLFHESAPIASSLVRVARRVRLCVPVSWRP